MVTSDELYQQLADIRTNGEKAIREVLNKLNTKSLNITYYVVEHEAEDSGFSAYDSNGYSNPAHLVGVEIEEDGSLVAHLDGDWECDEYVEDMMANEVAIILDILEQCVCCIEEDKAPIVVWGDNSWDE